MDNYDCPCYFYEELIKGGIYDYLADEYMIIISGDLTNKGKNEQAAYL